MLVSECVGRSAQGFGKAFMSQFFFNFLPRLLLKPSISKCKFVSRLPESGRQVTQLPFWLSEVKGKPHTMRRWGALSMVKCR